MTGSLDIIGHSVRVRGHAFSDRSRSPKLPRGRAVVVPVSTELGQSAKCGKSDRILKWSTKITDSLVEPKPEDDLLDGFSAAEIFEGCASHSGYTYDDLICLPGQIRFGVHEVNLDSMFTKGIQLKVPIVSSDMDTVTESKMAIAIALEGGIGVIHSNMTLEDQVREVVKVKKFRSGFITDPVCITPAMFLSELDALCAKHGFTGFPVTEDGHIGSRLLGLVTKRDTDFMQDRSSTRVSSIMTKVDQLTTAQEGVGLAEANQILRTSKKGKLPIVTKGGRLIALVARTDLLKHAEFPLATKDKSNSLMVAASVSSKPRDRDRVRALAAAGVDAIVVNSSQGDNCLQHELIRWIKEEFPLLQVVGGNVVTVRQAKHLIDSGVDGLRVGMGTSSIRATQEVCVCGRAQASAVYSVAKFAKAYNIPVIADGGVSSPGHIVKALSLGAGTTMCGSILAGTEESPGEYSFNDRGVRLKTYRGTGPEDDVNKGPNTRSFGNASAAKVAQGAVGTMQDKGSVHQYMLYLGQGLRHGLQDLGTKSATSLRQSMYTGQLRFELRSPAAQREGGVHGLYSFETRRFSSGAGK